MSLHLGMFKRMPDHLLNPSTTCSCASKAGMVGATGVASSAYHLLERKRLFEVSVYPFCVDFIHPMRSSTMRSKMSGERESPWSVPGKICTRQVHP